MPGRWGEAPFVALTASLVAGIALASFLTRYLFVPLALAAGLLAGAAFIAWRGSRFRLCLMLVLWALAVDGLLLGLAERDGFPLEDVRSLIARGAMPLDSPLLLEGCVTEDSIAIGLDMVTPVEIHGIRLRDDWVRAHGIVQLRLAIPSEPVRRAALTYGDRVRVWASCDVPRNFQNPGSTDRVGLLARRGIHLLGRIKSADLVEALPNDCGTPWDRAAASARRAFRSRIQKLRGEEGPQRAAVLSSIVLGDYSGLSSDTRKEFQETGTIHVLVVSGLHVGWIVWAVSRLLQILRLPVGVSRVLAAGAVLFYACLVGFQASISRALWMYLLYLCGQIIFRKVTPTNTLLACAFLLLSAHPGWLSDAGFQLSFLSVAAIVLTGAPAVELRMRSLFAPLQHAGDFDRLFLQAGRWPRLGRRLRFRAELIAESCEDRFSPLVGRSILEAARAGATLTYAIGSMILISVAVQLWLEPVLAFYFNRLSWVAPAANLAVVPLSSVVLAAGISAELLTAAMPSLWPVFRIAGACSALLLDVNAWFSALPGAWQRCPTPTGWWLLAGIVLLFLWSFLRRRRWWIPLAWVSAEIMILSLGALDIPQRLLFSFQKVGRISTRAARPPTLRISFLDVGQGDSIVVQFPDRRAWVIDAGGLWSNAPQDEDTNSFDTGEAIVSRFLWSRWTVKLDSAVLTHPHQDHAGGMPAILRNFPAARLDYANAGSETVLQRVLAAAQAAEVPVHAVQAGEKVDVAGVTLRVLSPVRAGASASLNDASVVLHLRFGRFSALLAGDLEATGETALLARERDLRGQLLKVGHHGSRTATSEPFLSSVRPLWAVISAGRNNPFHNPSPEIVLRLRRHHARPLLTMDQGAIFFDTDGVHYILSSYTHGILEQGNLPPE